MDDKIIRGATHFPTATTAEVAESIQAPDEPTEE